MSESSTMPAPIPDEPVRFQISLSQYENRMLRLWARLHGKPRATYGAQIIGARIEANHRDILSQLEVVAQSRGMTREELEAEWLGDEDD